MFPRKSIVSIPAFLLMLVFQCWNSQVFASVSSIFPVDDAYQTAFGQPLTENVTINDGSIVTFDTDLADRIFLVISPRNGELDWNWFRGEFTYTPDEGFSGIDFFKYRYCETNNQEPLEPTVCTNTVSVALTVDAAVNLAPLAVDDLLGTDYTGRSVLTNDTDPNGDTLTATLIQQPLYGTVGLDADGTFIYTLTDQGYLGEDSFTYRASDGELESNEATATITIASSNQPLMAVNDLFGTDYQGMSVLTNDTGSNLSAFKKSDPEKGTVTVNQDGTFEYSAFSGESGQDSFTYAARTGPLGAPDARESNVAVVTIQIAGDSDGGNIVGKADEDGYTVEGNASRQELDLGNRLDVICPQLTDAESEDADQSDLLTLCSNLRNTATSARQAVTALGAITPEEVVAQRTVVRQMSRTQTQSIEARMSELRRGARGVSLAGLNLRQDDSVVSGSSLDAMLDETLTALSGGNASADGYDEDVFGKIGLFVSGNLSFGDQGKTDSEAAFDFDYQSLTFGADYRVTDHLIMGVAASAGVSEIDFDDNGGDTEADNYTFALFGSFYTDGNAYVDAIVSYGWSDVDSKRNIVYQDAGGSVDRTAQGSTDADQYYVSLNAGYLFNSGGWSMVPSVRFYHMDGGIDAYDERGAQGWNLSFEDQDFQSTTVSIAGQLDYALSTRWGVVIPFVLMEYTREFEDDAQGVLYRFSSDPFVTDDKGGYLQILGDDADSNYMRYSVGVTAQFAHGVSGFLSYDLLGSYENLNSETVSLGLSWEATF